MNLIFIFDIICYTCAATEELLNKSAAAEKLASPIKSELPRGNSDSNPMEDNAMKKLLKNKVHVQTNASARPDTGKVRCYACVNGIVIPVL